MKKPKLQAAHDLLLELLLGAEHVRVVLGDVAHAQQAVQRAAGLVAVDEALLGVADRQVAVGAQVGLVDLHVGRAVHGLEAHGPVLDVGEVHVVAVHVPVARLAPQRRRRRGSGCAPRCSRAATFSSRHRSVSSFHIWVAVWAARRASPGDSCGDQEQPQLLAELPVVARAGLLQALQVLVQVAWRQEGRAVDAGQLGADGVAAPVGAGQRLQLEGLDGARWRARGGRGTGR